MRLVAFDPVASLPRDELLELVNRHKAIASPYSRACVVDFTNAGLRLVYRFNDRFVGERDLLLLLELDSESAIPAVPFMCVGACSPFDPILTNQKPDRAAIRVRPCMLSTPFLRFTTSNQEFVYLIRVLPCDSSDVVVGPVSKGRFFVFRTEEVRAGTIANVAAITDEGDVLHTPPVPMRPPPDEWDAEQAFALLREDDTIATIDRKAYHSMALEFAFGEDDDWSHQTDDGVEFRFRDERLWGRISKHTGWTPVIVHEDET